MKQIRKFIKLTNLAQKIMNSEADWETKRNLIFSKDISGKIRKTGLMSYYEILDISYESDVKGYVNALIEKTRELVKILEVE
jgi:hypothetical protein